MQSRLRVIGVVLSCALGLACSGDDATPELADADVFIPPDAGRPDAFVGPARALFEVPRPDAPPPSGFYGLPFPNDIRVAADGRIDFSDHIRPNAIIDLYFETFSEKQRGFGINGASFFRFSAPIDPATLPADADASRAESASVYLVDIDPESPAYGERVPLRFRFEHYAGEMIGDDWLSVLPFPGFPLRETTTYAVVVTDRVQATDGTPITRSPDFEAVMEDAPESPESGDTALADARHVYAPLLAWLDAEGGDDRDDVISASVFTTQNIRQLMLDVRETIWRELPMPTPRKVRWRKAYESYIWYDGVYDTPNFQTGEVPYRLLDDGGEIVRDSETGAPVIQRMEELRFSLSIPHGPMPQAGWPIVLYAHGTGGSANSFRSNGSASRLAAQGLAVIGIDQVLHNSRNPNSSPDISFFNFQNPLAARDNTLQGALDNFQLLRLVLDFDHTERHPNGRTIRFDPERIYFFGHSQGGLTGPPFIATEPLLKGAVLSGAGGLIYLSMLLKTEPLDIPNIVGAFIRDYPLDEFNPMLAMIQMWVDRSDPVSYGPLMVREPIAEVGAKHIFQSEGFIDRFTPPLNIEALATALGSHQVGPVIAPIEGLALRGRDVLTAPVTGNLDGITSVLLQYEQDGDSDGHFVVFDIPAAQTQSAEFLGTLSRTGEATLVAPQ